MRIIKSNYWKENTNTGSALWGASAIFYKPSKSKFNPILFKDKVRYQDLEKLVLLTKDNLAETLKEAKFASDNDIVVLMQDIAGLPIGKFAAYIELSGERKALVFANKSEVEQLTKHFEKNKAGSPATNNINYKSLIKVALVLLAIYFLFISPKSPQDGRSSANKVSIITACQNLIQGQSKYPSKVDFNDYTALEKGYGLIISGEVEMMNGLGLMLPKRYKCVYEDAGKNFTQAIIID